MFKFYLSEKQKEDVLIDLETANKAADDGEKGTVFCQVGQSQAYPDRIIVRGGFLPAEYAERLKVIMDEYFNGLDKE